MGNTIKKFWIRADARLVARIDRLAKRQKRSRASAVEVLLERSVAEQELLDATASKSRLVTERSA